MGTASGGFFFHAMDSLAEWWKKDELSSGPALASKWPDRFGLMDERKR